MAGVRVSEHFGIVVRKNALERNQIPLAMLLRVMEVKEPLDEDSHLISFGPHFGIEAVQEFFKRLDLLNLKYFEDYFDFDGTIPDWCQFYAEHHASSV